MLRSRRDPATGRWHDYQDDALGERVGLYVPLIAAPFIVAAIVHALVWAPW